MKKNAKAYGINFVVLVNNLYFYSGNYYKLFLIVP